MAREKAQAANVKIDFQVIDFLKDVSSSNLKSHAYDTVLDIAVFHFFSNDERQIYMKNFQYLIQPSGLFILLCFSEKETRKGGPRRVKTSDLEELFSSDNGWNIQSIEETIYESRDESFLPGGVQVNLLLIRRENN